MCLLTRDEGGVKSWLYTPVSVIEIKSLENGSLTLREMITNPSKVSFRVEFNEGSRQWNSRQLATPEEFELPKLGALLPYAQRNLAVDLSMAVKNDARIFPVTADSTVVDIGLVDFARLGEGSIYWSKRRAAVFA